MYSLIGTTTAGFCFEYDSKSFGNKWIPEKHLGSTLAWIFKMVALNSLVILL